MNGHSDEPVGSDGRFAVPKTSSTATDSAIARDARSLRKTETKNRRDMRTTGYPLQRIPSLLYDGAMESVFTRIIHGELPGRFVYRSDDIVAFLTIAPIKHGHTLIVPVREVDHWIDLTSEELSRLMEVAQRVGRAINLAFQPTKVAVIIAGLEVPHVHVHLVPIDSESELRFENADPNVPPTTLDAAAASITGALTVMDED